VLKAVSSNNEPPPAETMANERNNEKKDAVKNETAENELQVSWFENPPHIFIDKESGN